MPTVAPDARATLYTSMGEITFDLLSKKAPRTVENFVTLANKGFYDGLTFHRILKDFVIQGGCPKGNGTGGPGYTIKPEFNDTPHVPGTVSMARDNDPHSAGSQFFVCAGEARYLDSRFSAFGQVTDGLDVVEKIASVKTHDDNRHKEKSTPLEPVFINRIELEGVDFDDEASEGGSDGDGGDDGGQGGGGGRGRRRRGGGGKGGEDAAEASDDDGSGSGDDDKPKRPRKKASRKKPAAAKDDDGGGDDKPKRPRKKASRKKKSDDAESQE